MNNHDISPVFVVGTPRSGTTLTAKILGSHSTLFMPGETHFYDDVYSRRSLLGEPSTETGSHAIAQRLVSLYARFNEPDDQIRIDSIMSSDSLAHQIRERCNDYEDVLTLFMSTQARSLEKEKWGNNTPRDLFNIPLIAEFYPEARIVICVRDPRDFLGSYKGKWRNTADEEVDRLIKLYHPVVTSYLWKANMKSVNCVAEYISSSQVMVMKYEDLVTVPEETVRHLCEHVGVEYEPEMINVNFSNSSNGKSSTPAIFTSSIDQWRARISTEEAWIAQKINADEMMKYDYVSSPLSVNRLTVAGYFITTPAALWRALRANRNKRGPLIPYLLKRLNLKR